MSTQPLDPASLPATRPERPAHCPPVSLAGARGAWVPDWMDDQRRQDLVTEQARQLGLLDFFWLKIGRKPGEILHQSQGARPLDKILQAAANANNCGLRFVTIVDQRPLGGAAASIAAELQKTLATILFEPEARTAHIRGLAEEMARHPLADGLTIDYEYGLPDNLEGLTRFAKIGHFENLPRSEQVERVTVAYTALIRDLAAAMHHQGRLLRVAARVRVNDEVNYDSNLAPYVLSYSDLAQVSDQVVLMAYDFHWSTSNPGPIAPLANVQAVWRYVTSHQIPAGKLTLGVPAYAYDWIVDAEGRNSQGLEAAALTLTELTAKRLTAVGGSDHETRYTYTDQEGRPHEIWDTSGGLTAKVDQTEQLCGCRVMVWKLGNTDPLGSAAVIAALAP